MKRILYLLVAMIATTAATADDYPYLTFEKSDGTKQSVAVENLTLAISNGELVVNSGTYSFSLTDLTKMYFTTGDATSIEELATKLPADCSVEVFSLEGVSLGQFDSLQAARSVLQQGVFIFKIQGQTLKVTVK